MWSRVRVSRSQNVLWLVWQSPWWLSFSVFTGGHKLKGMSLTWHTNRGPFSTTRANFPFSRISHILKSRVGLSGSLCSMVKISHPCDPFPIINSEQSDRNLWTIGVPSECLQTSGFEELEELLWLPVLENHTHKYVGGCFTRFTFGHLDRVITRRGHNMGYAFTERSVPRIIK